MTLSPAIIATVSVMGLLAGAGAHALLCKLDTLHKYARVGLAVVAAGGLSALAFVQIERASNPAPVVTADIDGIIKAFIIQWGKKGETNEAKAEAEGQAFASRLTSAVETLATSRGVVVVPKGTIVAGRSDVPDVTQEIIAAVEAKAKQEK